jgi:uncharacterized protein DUF4190
VESTPAESDGAETSGLAIASLVLGIFWVFGLASIAAIVVGVRAKREIDASGGALGGRVLAIAGIAIGIAGLASSGLLIAFVIASAHH